MRDTRWALERRVHPMQASMPALCQGMLCLALIIFLFISIPACTNSNQAPGQAAVSQVWNEKLKTVIVENYYPYTFINKEGLPDGFSVDLMQAVAQVMGFGLEIKPGPWEHARLSLINGDIDFLPMMAYSGERDKYFDFSVPHTIAYDAFFTRRGTATIRTTGDLRGKRIIVMEGDQAHDYLKSIEFIRGDQLVLVDGLPQALQMLASGEGDTALMPKLVGLLLIKDLNLTNLEISPAVVEAYNRPFSFAVREGNQALLERLSQGLSIVKATGQYKEIYSKWFGTLEPPGISPATVFTYIGVAILVLITVGGTLFSWAFALRKQVALRTALLEREVTEHKRAESMLIEREEQLRQSNELMAGVLGHTHMMAVYLDSRFNFIWVNQAYADTCQYDQSFFPGKNHFELYPDEENQSIFQRVVDTGEPFFVEAKPFIFPDQPGRGVTYWDWSLVPTKDPSGKTTGLVFTLAEVTARKLAEMELVKSNERLMLAQEASKSGAWDWDITTGELNWSEELFRIFGLDPAKDSATFDTWRRVMHPEDTQMAEEKVNKAILDHIKLTNEYRVVLPEGEVRWIDAYGDVQYDHTGAAKRMVGICVDVTVHRQAEQAAKESEGLYRLLATNSEDVIWTLDTQFRFTYISPSVYKLRGLTQKEAMQESFADTLTPDSLERVNELIESRLPDLETGSAISARLDIQQYRKDGSTVWVSISVRTMADDNGTWTGFVGISHDISDRKRAEQSLKESEERYRMLVEHGLEAIFVAKDEVLQFTNNRAVQLTGYSQEEIFSMRFMDIIHPDDRQTVAERRMQRATGMSVPNIYPLRIISKSGEIKWVEISVALINEGGSRLTLIFLNDITDRKRLEEEQQRVARLESVGLLAGGIAHDFNNILTAIVGNISLARLEAAPGSEIHSSLEQAEKASLQAKNLTQQLLTFSRGGAPVKRLASVIELIRDTANFALRGSNVKCNFSIPDNLWHAEIDAGQVGQVIQNLVINSQQAMPEGGSIDLLAENISLGETQSLGRGLPLMAGNYIRIAVTDHGSGIAAENLDKVFDPFFTTKKKGSGLGLATSFSIARSHGGHLSVESEYGSGSTFNLYLPASTETLNALPERKEPIRPAGKARIMVMDDEQGIREVAGRMLKYLGYVDFEFASDGAEAIKLYKAAMKSGNPFSVVIMDLTIPGGMGGIATIGELLTVDPGAKAIVSSGYTDKSVMAKYKDFGFIGMLAKPYSTEQLGKALQDVIG